MLFEFNDINSLEPLDMIYMNNNNDDLYSSKEGFFKGNMFKDEYEQYKNYKPENIVPNNKKEELELKLFKYDFAINDLNLYLDLHPDDKDMFNKFKEYVKKYNEASEEYINLVGPLCLKDVTSSNYNWLGKFPWEKGGINNV